MVTIIVPRRRGNKLEGFKEVEVSKTLAEKMFSLPEDKRPSTWQGATYKSDMPVNTGVHDDIYAVSERDSALKEVALLQGEISKNQEVIKSLQEALDKSLAENEGLVIDMEILKEQYESIANKAVDSKEGNEPEEIKLKYKTKE